MIYQQLINGLMLGASYSLVAIGYTLIFGVLNLLYYVSPDWSHESGGNLELWDNGPEGQPREIVSRQNRLVLMATHKTSWHSAWNYSITPLADPIATGTARREPRPTGGKAAFTVSPSPATPS